MIHDPKLLDKLQALGSAAWRSEVFRHTFGNYEPQRENTSGARWNPREVAAIYTSLQRETVLAEVEHQLALQPVRPSARRVLHRIRVELASVVDLRDTRVLEDMGISSMELQSPDFGHCQRVGGAVAWLKHDGLLVPSARHRGANLVILPTNGDTLVFEVVMSEVMP